VPSVGATPQKVPLYSSNITTIAMPSRKEKTENSGCGCASIPISLIVVVMAMGYWGFKHFKIGELVSANIGNLLPDTIAEMLPNHQQSPSPNSASIPAALPSTPAALPSTPEPKVASTPSPLSQVTVSPSQPQNSKKPLLPKPSEKASLPTAWEKKAIRGIYLSRYQVTNNASEQTIRERVRYYRKQGINTIIHGVWGNGCTMYNSNVMQQTFGFKSCPNQFREQWLEWLIDEAHKQGMQVHAYFEKGIKLDKNSPIFNQAIANRWIVPGVDKTYAGIDHYVLDMEIPEVSNFFRMISVEFVKKYPNIDAVQWDDYLGYHADLPGNIDRTARLTSFVRQMRADIKKANPSVSFDLCHHNPYWGKRYFAADWQNWQADRVFIQTYNDANFAQELAYAEQYAGVAISDQQLYRLKQLVNNPKIKGVLIFPFAGKPEEAAARINQFTPVKN
jgi:uncharacterized lipoprotein YddW (UPF0748 family)